MAFDAFTGSYSSIGIKSLIRSPSFTITAAEIPSPPYPLKISHYANKIRERSEREVSCREIDVTVDE